MGMNPEEESARASAAKRDRQLIRLVDKVCSTAGVDDRVRAAALDALEQLSAERSRAQAELARREARARDLEKNLDAAKAEIERLRIEISRLLSGGGGADARSVVRRADALKLPVSKDGHVIAPGAIMAGGDGQLWEIVGIGGWPYRCIGLGAPGPYGDRSMRPLRPGWLHETTREERAVFREQADKTSWPTLRKIREIRAGRAGGGRQAANGQVPPQASKQGKDAGPAR